MKLFSYYVKATLLLDNKLVQCWPGLQMNYNNKNMLVGALLVAGYDEHNGGQVRSVTHSTHSTDVTLGFAAVGGGYLWCLIVLALGRNIGRSTFIIGSRLIPASCIWCTG